MPAFSARLELALRFAAEAHRDQVRKQTAIPYITHPFHVALLLERHGFDEETSIVALLHDVVEDARVPIEAIEQAFGRGVADAVAALTEPEKNIPWETRKRRYLEQIARGPQRALAVAAADKLHNLRTIALDLQAGEDVFARFSRGAAVSIAYYREFVSLVRSCLDHPLVSELAAALREVEERAADAGIL
ncbi:MAG: HD domain-containing protein [Planctomycetota bacterium]